MPRSAASLHHLGQILRRHHCAGRIARRIQDNEFGAGSHQARDHIGGHAESGGFLALQHHAVAARVADDVFE